MLTLKEKNMRSAKDTLQSFREALHKKERVIPFNGDFYFTKGNPGKSSGYIFREIELEKDVVKWLNSRSSFQKIMSRYQKYDRNLSSIEWPSHYAVRFINAEGCITKCENIFMFFPEVLGIKTGDIEDYFGLEFIDMWVAVFDEIVFPCMRRVFDEESQIRLYSTLRPSLEKTIYLASVFHEIGHRCGYWKVSPTKDYRISINQMNTDILGELATDTLLVNFMHEFDEIKYFVFLQRLFWFGRFGFKNNSVSGKLNSDNDTWIGSYLWNKYVGNNVLTTNSDGKLHIDFFKLENIFYEVLLDIDNLGKKVSSIDKKQQDLFIYKWMIKRVKYNDERFCYSEGMRSLFNTCIDIKENPIGKF